MTSLNQFWGLVPVYASSLPCRAENKLDFNPTSSLLSSHLILLALHGKIFLQAYIFLALVFWEEAETQIQFHTTPHLPVATHSNAGLARAMLGGNLLFQKECLFPPSPPSQAYHSSTGLSAQPLHPPLCPTGTAALLSDREYPLTNVNLRPVRARGQQEVTVRTHRWCFVLDN